MPSQTSGRVRIRLVIGDHSATATLADTPRGPGAVRLGTIDAGPDVIAAAGNEFQMRIEPLD
jgi:hypothetical protein